MGIVSTIRDWIRSFLKTETKEQFNIVPPSYPETESAIDVCARAYTGNPPWTVNPADGIITINFAQSVCAEIARLTTLGISVKVDGSPRAEWLQGEVDKMFYLLRQWVEYAAAYGLVLLKPNGETVDCYTPGEYEITKATGETVTGAVFVTRHRDADGKTYYTRLESHQFDDDGVYQIRNRCFRSTSATSKGDAVSIDQTPWAGMLEETAIEGLERPLFAILRTPGANNLDVTAPLALPACWGAMQELRDLDIAYTRAIREIEASKRTVLLDTNRLLTGLTAGGSGIPGGTPAQLYAAVDKMGLPSEIRLVDGGGLNGSSMYQEINPSLNTEQRLVGINALLSQIGYKAGFSNGYFVFNQRSGLATATQVEADQQRTIQLIKDYRDQLENALTGLLYALDQLADLYGLAPVGEYETSYDFGDITYNRDEDRARWLSYANGGKVPFWYYLTKFEGMTEDEARELVEQGQPKEPPLFGGEE